MTVVNGGTFWIYDQPARNGCLTDWHMDTFAEVSRFLRRRQAVYQVSTSARHVALLHSQTSFYASNNYHDAPSMFSGLVPSRLMTGALQLLLDNHHHTDMVNEDTLAGAAGRLPRNRRG